MTICYKQKYGYVNQPKINPYGQKFSEWNVMKTVSRFGVTVTNRIGGVIGCPGHRESWGKDDEEKHGNFKKCAKLNKMDHGGYSC